MSNSPSFQPLGRIPQSSGNRPNFRIVVVAFVALHAVFFAGLLLQGCRPKTDLAEEQAPTNALPDISALFGAAWTNPPTPPRDLADEGTAPPSATNPPLALEERSTSTEETEEPAGTNQLGGGRTPGQQMLGQASGRPPGPGVADPGVGLTTETTEDLAQAREHKIQRGDTFWSISRQYGVTPQAIRNANPGVVPERLQVDHVLVVPPAKPQAPTLEESYAGQIHTVKRGDTLSGLGNKYGVGAAEIRALNNLRTDVIKVGDKLKIPPKPGS